MKAWILASLVFVLGLSSASGARADCATPPGACYCRAAAAAIDGHIEALAENAVSVRVDSVVLSATPPPSAPQAGSVVDIPRDALWVAAPAIGDRIVAAYDSGGQVVAPADIVTSDGQVHCDGSVTITDATEATSWWVMDRSACQQAVDQKFGEYSCDDTGTACGVEAAKPSASSLLPFALAAAWLLGRARRRAR